MGHETSLGFMLNHAGRRITHLLNLHFHKYDMTTEQWSVLNRLAEQDGVSQKTLAIRAEKDQTNITRLLDQLERKGLVERTVNPDDRRSFLIMITEKGRALNDVLVPIERKVVSDLEANLPPEQLELLWACLHQITQQANQIIAEVEGHH